VVQVISFVGPNPPTPFPAGEGGDFADGACVSDYLVGKDAVKFLAADTITA